VDINDFEEIFESIFKCVGNFIPFFIIAIDIRFGIYFLAD